MEEPRLEELTTEARNPRSLALDAMTSLDFVRLMHDEERRAVAAVATQAPAIAEAIDRIAERMQRGGRLIYCGAGTSGRLGVLDAAECPPTFQTAPSQVIGLIAGGDAAFLRAVEGAEDDPERGAMDLRSIDLRASDAVVGIAASGRTPYVLGALAEAARTGALRIGLSCNADSPVARAGDVAITPVVGPEVLSGSTRLKAGTATKLVLNMLSTGAMVKLGKTYGNLMVDLQATNRKLVARSRRIVALATGGDEAAAVAALQRCDGEVKTAIVALRLGLDPAAARARLVEHGGWVRAALGDHA